MSESQPSKKFNINLMHVPDKSYQNENSPSKFESEDQEFLFHSPEKSTKPVRASLLLNSVFNKYLEALPAEPILEEDSTPNGCLSSSTASPPQHQQAPNKPHPTSIGGRKSLHDINSSAASESN
jgi:hypothetical protein